MTGKSVPFLDLRAGYLALKSEIDAAVSRVLDSGWYILGPEVETFETAFAKFCEAEHCVGVANGLDALILSLRALDVGPGDEVIVPSNTFIATWLAVSAVGALPVPVEPDPLTYNIDPLLVPAAITSKTRAIIAVHLYGQPCDLDPLIAIGRKHGISVIEDAAQAHSAEYKKARVGGRGDVVCWSFYPGKNLGALGDGGAITTNRADIAARIRTLRNYGSNQKYVNVEQGTNSRLDPIQAAILSVKLDHLVDWTSKRQAIAKNYLDNLRGVTLPFVPDWAVPVWHLFVIRHEKRDELMSSLAAEGISTLVHYPIPPHLQEAYKTACYEKGSFPLTEQFAEDMLSLPIGPQMPIEDQNRVIEAVNRLAAKL
ncbi:DegT/DnrJ/EryC1/StrS family aminotransferase [Pacificibacter marinus]|uniref:dTDP-3-amino-3, 6-dideoxy-alpha-D-galactopyranose transaminase n=1 Tax=Pacificibacter marinus TaxID=658057 RepID=A0A1Y5RVY9_9RHOB|nr:DegT/DnrJ/EryC1/StrS family aminotransferase [Pacificibacter marinus]SEK36740.1 dTDP-4-amino-4,6-dideoxygalactose transaminase [Pacificibacter marinus]SLN26554.1 dTDP-3-amino-3, 6-dideoxy-alpha-D-galactopyranose transaminase [Pacificibacter marinus]